MTLACGCPEHYPDWHDNDIDLGGHRVLTLPIGTFLHMPIGYDVYVGRMRQMLKQLELKERWPNLLLTQTGWLKGRVIALLEDEDNASPSRHVSRLPSPFNIDAMLHNGGMGTIRNAVRQMQSRLLDQGRMPKELYLCHLTCDRCSDERGGELIMVLRRWEPSRRLSGKVSPR